MDALHHLICLCRHRSAAWMKSCPVAIFTIGAWRPSRSGHADRPSPSEMRSFKRRPLEPSPRLPSEDRDHEPRSRNLRQLISYCGLQSPGRRGSCLIIRRRYVRVPRIDEREFDYGFRLLRTRINGLDGFTRRQVASWRLPGFSLPCAM